MPGYWPSSICVLQPVILGTAGDVDQRRQPVQRREQLVLDRARLDVARPAHDHRSAVAAFPGLAFLALERRDAAVREADRLGAVVGSEDDDRVIELAHVLELLEHDADIVVHLLHAGFVDAPVLAALLAHHRLVLRRQHGRDVHARRVVPDEERLVGFLGIVAVKEVDDLGGDLLVHRLRAIQRQRTLVIAGLVRLRAVGGMAPEHWPRRRQANCGLGIDSARDLGDAGDRRVAARRSDALHASGSC